MSQEFKPYNYGRYERNRKSQKFFTFLKMISLPLLLMVLAVPGFIFYKAHKQLNSPQQSSLPPVATQTVATETNSSNTTELSSANTATAQSSIQTETLAPVNPQDNNDDVTRLAPSDTGVALSQPPNDPMLSTDLPLSTNDSLTSEIQNTETVVKTASVEQTTMNADAIDTTDPETQEISQAPKPLVIDSTDPFAEQLRNTSEALLADISRVEDLLNIKKMEVQMLEEKLDNARALLDSQPIIVDQSATPAISEAAVTEATVTEAGATESATTSMPSDSALRNELWLESQNPDAFVIQIASSTDFQALADYVGDIGTEQPKAIYPFQATRDGDLVYGASIGIHSTRDLAVQRATELAESEGLNGAWIRPIREISAQVNTVKGLN